MRFCPRDGILMMPVRRSNATILRCPKCGYEEAIDNEAKTAYKSKAIIDKKNDILIAAAAFETLPKVKAVCPKCGNEEAYMWMQQTRAADEPPTRFYRCAKCGYTWREYA